MIEACKIFPLLSFPLSKPGALPSPRQKMHEKVYTKLKKHKELGKLKGTYRLWSKSHDGSHNTGSLQLIRGQFGNKSLFGYQ